MQEWRPRPGEDELLERYVKRGGGVAFVEVPVGGPSGPGGWSAGCATRRIDAIRFPRATSSESIRAFDRDAFALAVCAGEAELIEVKRALSEGAIGQVIAGAEMFERQYGCRPSRAVVLCGHADPALHWACTRLGVEVEVMEHPFKSSPEGVRKKRWSSDEDALLHRYLHAVRGPVIRCVPVGGPAWPGSVVTSVDAILPVAAGDASVAAVENVRGPVEIIEVTSKLVRGSIGRSLVLRELLQKQYGLNVERTVLVFGRGDSALEWVCRQRGIVPVGASAT